MYCCPGINRTWLVVWNIFPHLPGEGCWILCQLPLLLLLFRRLRTSTTTIHAQCSLPDLNHDEPRPVFAAGPQPRPATSSVRCRTSTTTIHTPSVRCRTSTTTSHAQCSLPDLNHDQPRPVFAAGPQPRPATPSVRCRTSTTTSHAQCSLRDLNHDHQRPVFAAGPQLLCQKLCQIECQKICQIECQKICQIECQKI